MDLGKVFYRNSRTIRRVPLNALRLPDLALKRHPKKQIEKVRKFLAANDQIPLVYAGPDGEILFGDEIWLALNANGATEVDAVFIHDKSPKELKAIRLALHRIPADAMWDDQNVRLTLEELASANFDLELTGFDAPEIDSYLNLDLPNANAEETGSDIPPVGTASVSAPGSIWKLGNHRIGCGSATDHAFVVQVLNGQTAATGFIDPPYNIKVDGFISGEGRRRHRQFVQGAGELSDDDYFTLLRNALSVLKACSDPSALLYACIDWRHIMEMTVAGRACGMPLCQIITWVKSNAGMGGIYRNQSEFICVFRAGDGTPLDNVELGRRGRNRTNVWNYPDMSSFGKERDSLLGRHPTVKAVGMIADALRDVTKRGDVVVDTFLGSGSTIMAAEETGRVGCGVELDPLYVDVVIRRWQNATGRDAVLFETGEPFNAFAQRRLAAPSEPNHGG
jgi:DNA modification methylase